MEILCFTFADTAFSPGTAEWQAKQKKQKQNKTKTKTKNKNKTKQNKQVIRIFGASYFIYNKM